MIILREMHRAMTSEEKENKVCIVLLYWRVILSRLLLTLHCLLAVWRVTLARNDDTYWLLLLLCLLFIVEGIITTWKRKLEEKSVVSFCFLFYLASILPPIWLLETDRHEKLLRSAEDNSTTSTILTSHTAENKTIDRDVFAAQISSLFDSVDLRLDPETWVLTIEETVIYMLFLTRWLLPRGRVSREQLSDILTDFLGSGSDIMEFFGLFGFTQVASDTKLTYLILGFWSLSLTRFTLTLQKVSNGSRIRRRGTVRRRAVKVITEIAEIFVVIFLQDGPFLVVRAYAMSKYSLVSYSLIFFVIKNVLLIMLSVYRVLVKITVHPCWDVRKKDEEKGTGSLERTMLDPPQRNGSVAINQFSDEKSPDVNISDEEQSSLERKVLGPPRRNGSVTIQLSDEKSSDVNIFNEEQSSIKQATVDSPHRNGSTTLNQLSDEKSSNVNIVNEEQSSDYDNNSTT